MAARKEAKKVRGVLRVAADFLSAGNTLERISKDAVDRALGGICGAKAVQDESGMRLSLPKSRDRPALAGSLLWEVSGDGNGIKCVASADLLDETDGAGLSFFAELTARADGSGTELGYQAALTEHGNGGKAPFPGDDVLRAAAEVFLVRLLDSGTERVAADTGEAATAGAGAQADGSAKKDVERAGDAASARLFADASPVISGDSGYWWSLCAVAAVIAALAVLSRW